MLPTKTKRNNMKNEEIEIEETWRPLNMEAFKYSYEISSQGRVRSKSYPIFKNSKLYQTEPRILKEFDETVYLNSQYCGEYKIDTLYKHSFPNTKLDEQRR